MGNSNLRRSMIATETTLGTLVDPPTVNLQGLLSIRNAPQRELRDERRYSMGGSNTYDDLSLGSTGTYRGRLTTREFVYILAASVRGDPTISTPVGGTASRQWLFTQPLTTIPALKSWSAYVGDNTQMLASPGVLITDFTITGSDRAAWTVDANLIGWEQVTVSAPSVIAALTGNALADNASIKNLLSTLAIDAVGGTIGTTVKTATGYSFTYRWNSGITWDYLMNGTLNPTDVQRDAPSATLDLTTKWNANAVTEFGHYDSGATRLVRLKNEETTAIETTIKRTAMIDGAYVYTDFVPLDNERDGTTLGRLTLTAVEDATYTKKAEFTVINTHAALL